MGDLGLSVWLIVTKNLKIYFVGMIQNPGSGIRNPDPGIPGGADARNAIPAPLAANGGPGGVGVKRWECILRHMKLPWKTRLHFGPCPGENEYIWASTIIIFIGL